LQWLKFKSIVLWGAPDAVQGAAKIEIGRNQINPRVCKDSVRETQAERKQKIADMTYFRPVWGEIHAFFSQTGPWTLGLSDTLRGKILFPLLVRPESIDF